MGLVGKGNGIRAGVRRALNATRLDSAALTPPVLLQSLAVSAPHFPDRSWNIPDFGAIADNKTNCAASINDAITTCHDSGGGVVRVPAGLFFTGAIHLRSNVNLRLEEGAVLRFSDDPDDYLPPVHVRWDGMDCMNYSPLIHAENCRNIAITGAGQIRGGGVNWRGWVKEEQRSSALLYDMVVKKSELSDRVFGSAKMPLRPQLIGLVNCQEVLLEGFSIIEGGPFWGIHLMYCTGVLARNLTITTMEGENNDGIVVDSTSNVIIEDCAFRTNGDCIAMKSGLNEDGWRVGKPTENVLVRRVKGSGTNSAVAIGTEMSGDVRNIRVHHCEFENLETVFRLKAARGRGGVVENIFLENCVAAEIAGDAISIMTDSSAFSSPDGRAPAFRNLALREFVCRGAGRAGHIFGLPDEPLEHLRLDQVEIVAREGLALAFVRQSELSDVKVQVTLGPLLSIKDCQDVVINGLHQSQSRNVFLDLRGRQTRGIRLRGKTRVPIPPAVVLGIDVPKDALIHH